MSSLCLPVVSITLVFLFNRPLLAVILVLDMGPYNGWSREKKSLIIIRISCQLGLLDSLLTVEYLSYSGHPNERPRGNS